MAESAESMTSYQYAGNNPVMYNDPLGNIKKAPQDDPMSYSLPRGGAGGNNMFANADAIEAYVNGVTAWGAAAGGGSDSDFWSNFMADATSYINTNGPNIDSYSNAKEFAGLYNQFEANGNTGQFTNSFYNNDLGVIGAGTTILAQVNVVDGDFSHLASDIQNEAYATNYYSAYRGGNANQGGIGNEAAIAKTFLSGYMQTLPYSMSDKEGTIDCSRCTMQIAAKAGYSIPRTAYDQAKWYQKNGYWSTNLSDAKPGDHMFWLRGVNLYHTGVISNISATGIISVVQANVNNYDIPSIHQFNLQPDGTMRGFNQPFVGLGRYP